MRKNDPIDYLAVAWYFGCAVMFVWFAVTMAERPIFIFLCVALAMGVAYLGYRFIKDFMVKP